MHAYSRKDFEEWKEFIHIVKVAETFTKFQGIYRDYLSDDASNI